jgi:hypothetical protein
LFRMSRTDDRRRRMTESNDVQQEVQDLRHDLDVQAATQAGAQATQAATQAGQAATQAAAVSGVAAAVGSGFVAFVVGIFLGMAIVKANN